MMSSQGGNEGCLLDWKQCTTANAWGLRSVHPQGVHRALEKIGARMYVTKTLMYAALIPLLSSG